MTDEWPPVKPCRRVLARVSGAHGVGTVLVPSHPTGFEIGGSLEDLTARTVADSGHQLPREVGP